MSKQLMGEEPAANGIGFCLVGIPFAAACFFREQIRVHYNIGGHAIIDAMCAIFCLQCSLCQIYRQLQAKPVMRSKLSSDFSSKLYEFYQVRMRSCALDGVRTGIWLTDLTYLLPTFFCCLTQDVPTTLIVCIAPCIAFGTLRRKMGQDCFWCVFSNCMPGVYSEAIQRTTTGKESKKKSFCTVLSA